MALNRCALIALFILTICSLLRAQPLADRIPDTALVYAGWSGDASVNSTAAAKMLADERVTRPWRMLIQSTLLSMHEDSLTRLSDDMAQALADASQCQGCFAILDLPANKSRAIPRALFMVDLGAKRKSFEQHFKPIHDRLKESLGNRVQMMKLENSWIWVKPDRQNKPQLVWGYVGDAFVIYAGADAEQFLPQLLKGKLEKNLLTDPEFSAAMSKVPGQGIVVTYVKASAISQLAKSLQSISDISLPIEEWKTTSAQIGIDNILSIADKTSVESGQFITRSLVHTKTPPHGLLAMLAEKGVDDSMWKCVPADAMTAIGFHLDLPKAYADVKKTAVAIDGPEAKRNFDQIENVAKGFGIPVTDILEPLGDQWIIYNATSTGGSPLTGWTLVATVRDPERFHRTIEALRRLATTMFGGAENERRQVREYEVDGSKIQYIDQHEGFVPFTTAWTIEGDKFIVSLYPQLVEDAIKQLRGSKSILDNPEFTALRKRVGADRPMVFISGPEITRSLYPWALVFLTAISSFGENSLPAEGLPSYQRMLTYVGYDAASAAITPDGFVKTESVANPLLSPLSIDSPLFWILAASPEMLGQASTRDRITSASNLRQIGQGMLLYANDNKGLMPPDLATVKKTQDISPDVFDSPLGDVPGGDYVYLHYQGMKSELKPEIVIAYDAAALQEEDGTNVLYGDGHVEWVDKAAFEATLTRSRQLDPKSAQVKASPTSPAP